MIRFAFAFFTLIPLASAYVPTLESLLRHGSNPEVSVDGISLTFSVKKLLPGNKSTGVEDVALLSDSKEFDFYKLFFSKVSNDILKVAQTRYDNATFSESSLLEKIYYPNFTPYTVKGVPEESERGIFLGILKSIAFNNGSFLINYLKSLGVPVKLNSELINKEKVEFLGNYKHYLATINKDRAAKKTEINPLRPEEVNAKEKADKIMSESMYVDTQQVKISREDGQLAWLVSAGPFEAVISYKERDLQKVKFKSSLGEFEVICKDYWLANGTHSVPRFMIVKDYKGESFQIEITNLRHYNERDEDIIRRLKKWDELLKGKVSTVSRPAFLL